MSKNNQIRRGSYVVCKDDPKKQLLLVLEGPPVIIGDPVTPRGVFPIILDDRVSVRLKYKGKAFTCIEKVTNLEVATRDQIRQGQSKKQGRSVRRRSKTNK